MLNKLGRVINGAVIYMNFINGQIYAPFEKEF